MTRRSLYIENLSNASITITSFAGSQGEGIELTGSGGVCAPGARMLVGNIPEPGFLEICKTGTYYFSLDDVVYKVSVRNVNDSPPTSFVTFAKQKNFDYSIEFDNSGSAPLAHAYPVFGSHYASDGMNYDSSKPDAFAGILRIFQVPVNPKFMAGWMGALFPAIKDTPLNRLWLPGSHDTCTYGAHPSGIKADFVITQEKTVYEQLCLGARYLDVRCKYEDNMWKTFHGSYNAAPLQEVLEDIVRFVRQYRWEVVLIDITHLGWKIGADDSRDEELVAYIHSICGSVKLDARHLQPDSSMDEIANTGGWKKNDGSNRNLIFMYPKGAKLRQTYDYYDLWDRDQVFHMTTENPDGNNRWYNRTDTFELADLLQADCNLRNHPPTDGLFVSQIQGTPNSAEPLPCYVLARIFNVFMGYAYNRVDDQNPAIKMISYGFAGYLPNILLQDYLNITNLTQFCMDANLMVSLNEFVNTDGNGEKYSYSTSFIPTSPGWRYNGPVFKGYKLPRSAYAPFDLYVPQTIGLYEYSYSDAGGYQFRYSTNPSENFGGGWRRGSEPIIYVPQRGRGVYFTDPLKLTGRIEMMTTPSSVKVCEAIFV